MFGEAVKVISFMEIWESWGHLFAGWIMLSTGYFAIQWISVGKTNPGVH